MHVTENPEEIRTLCTRAIERFGFLGDHNLKWFEYGAQPGEYIPAIFSWPDGTAIMAYREPKQWTFVVEPLAPAHLSNDRLIEAATYVLDQPDMKKVVLECRQPERKK